MGRRVTILGGGHGVASVLRALRDHELVPTAIVTVADDGGSSGALRRRWGCPAVGDIRRSLIALAGEENAPARALDAPVAIARFGEHPLGNLLLCTLAKAFGELEAASGWLGAELGLSGRILPATAEPVALVATTGTTLIHGESMIGTAPGTISGLRFEPPRPQVPSTVVDAIVRADWVILAPGSLFTSVLAVAALPDIRSALERTQARLVWICNLEPERNETVSMTAAEHLAALRRHGVRVDAVLYDPAARLAFAREQLAAERLNGQARALASTDPGRHDPVLLSHALRELFSGGSARVPVQLMNTSR